VNLLATSLKRYSRLALIGAPLAMFSCSSGSSTSTTPATGGSGSTGTAEAPKAPDSDSADPGTGSGDGVCPEGLVTEPGVDVPKSYLSCETTEDCAGVHIPDCCTMDGPEEYGINKKFLSCVKYPPASCPEGKEPCSYPAVVRVLSCSEGMCGFGS